VFETANKMEVLWYVSKYAVIPDFGNPTRQYFLSKSFSQKGKKVTLISSRSSALSNFPSIGFKNKIEILDENLKCVIINGPKINLGFNYNRIISWIVFELRFLAWAFFSKKERPSVIIVSSLSLLTFLSGVILKKYYGCKLVCEVRDIWPLTISQLIKWKQFNPFLLALQRIESYAYKKANIIVGTMPNLREHVSNIDASLESKVFYIPMGFSKEFYSKENKHRIDPFLNIFQSKIPVNSFKVGYAGTIGLINCIDQLIDAASILRNESIVFLILGSGSEKSALLKKVESLNLKNVYFFDSVDKDYVHYFLQKCDILVHPIGKSEIYKFGVSPNKWIDYMYSAKPILVTYSGYKSIINEADCGKFIAANNLELLSDEIIRFSNMSKNDLNEIGNRGKEFLETRLSYDYLSSKYLNLINDLGKN
jgi:hypothetical protein